MLFLSVISAVDFAFIFSRVKHLILPACLILSSTMAWAKLSPLAPEPDWSKLNIFQETITEKEFTDLLNNVYAPNGAWKDSITIYNDSALIKTRPGESPYLLRFAPFRAAAKPVSTYWRKAKEIPMVPDKPLAGLKIAIDPGHIGGSWAKMEERWFQIGNSKPVTEGDMTLKVAKMVAPRLEALGAEVFLTRTKNWPVTSQRPDKLEDAATASLADKNTPATPEAIQDETERLFYRASEIRRRSRLVNENIRPDVVLCLHFNAEAWGDEKDPRLVDENHLHFLITGALSASELDYEDQRYDMLVKLLNRSFGEELALTNALARSMTKETGLPPYFYRQANAIRVNNNSYIWARNLLANRLFACPTVYFEPYVMNSKLVFARIQAGDYSGTRNFGGAMRKSIYREYADGIVSGLLAYYSARSL